MDQSSRIEAEAEAAALREAAIQASLRELISRSQTQRGSSASVPSSLSLCSSVAEQSEPAVPNSGQLLVVANRLPITVSRDAAGEYQFKMSSGGLVSALVSVRDKLPFVWIGWLGKEIPPEDQPGIKRRLLAEYRCLPVFLTDALADKFYSGMSNDVLWPLLHYEVDVSGAHVFDWALWDAYKAANALFAEAVLSVAAAGRRRAGKAQPAQEPADQTTLA